MKYTHNVNVQLFYRILLIIFSLSVVLHAQSKQQIKNQLKNLGINQDRAREIAKSKGYSDKKIDDEVQKRSIDIDKSKQDNEMDTYSEDNDYEINANYDDNKEILTETVDVNVLESLLYFGYQIFMGDPSAFQSSTFGVVDPSYNIGAGDQIIVMLWGESQFRQEFTIDREGYVFLPEVGQVFVNGLNLEALEKKFFQILSKVYSTLNPASGRPTTFMDVSLGDLRPLRVIVLGEVSQPGAYSVSPSTSLSSSLYYFNGPVTSGSLRDIRLLRKDKLIGKIDFYDYLLYGKVPDDLRLQMDDIVFIPGRGKTVTIKGEINRQGIYELKEKEKLKDLIEIAGGLSVTAYLNRLQISRIVPKDKRISIGMDRMILDIDLNNIINNEYDIELNDGDTINVFPVTETEGNYVTINSNSVMRPGRYQLTPGMSVFDLIQTADGLLNDAYLERAHIRRFNEDLTKELITLNLYKIINQEGKTVENIKLKFMDELIIYNENQLKNIFNTVMVNGPVKNIGNYSLEIGKTLGDLIILAGGFKKNVNKVKITVARSNINSFNPTIFSFPENKSSYINIYDLEDKNSEINSFILSSNDLISIYSDPRDQLPNTININGAVLFPGIYPILSQNEKISDIIKRSGGFLPAAYPMASTFVRNKKIIKLSFDDIMKNPKSAENFTVMNGDTIIINTKTNIVEIVGAVNEPGIYKYYTGYSLKKYLALAGGLNSDSEKNEIWVTYPNGVSKQLKKFRSSPKVFDGSTITVGIKEDVEPFDVTEFSKDLTDVLANLAQVLIFYSAIKN